MNLTQDQIDKIIWDRFGVVNMVDLEVRAEDWEGSTEQDIVDHYRMKYDLIDIREETRKWQKQRIKQAKKRRKE